MITKLDWGCAFEKHAGWIGSDLIDYGQDHVGDILDGLPYPDGCLDLIASHHGLQMIRFDDLWRVLPELRRVLKVGGVLRLSVPDAELAIRRWLSGGHKFPIEVDIEGTVDGQFLRYLFWHGDARSDFTGDSLSQTLTRNGFQNARRCRFKQTFGRHPDIVDLDSREDESLIVECTR